MPNFQTGGIVRPTGQRIAGCGCTLVVPLPAESRDELQAMNVTINVPVNDEHITRIVEAAQRTD